jgi:anti-sigma factor (TIGR02949 family)
MECPEVTERLWEYLDGELAAKEAAAVRKHVAGCAHCSSHCRCDQAFLNLVVRALAGNCRVPPGLQTAVLARLVIVREGR